MRRNIAEMASDISTDFADLNARVDILLDATNALQEATRRFDAKLDLLLEASFKKGWERLKLAAGASSESRCERLLERAEDAFVDSYSLLKNERFIAARYGAALAQVQLGELTNALATLEEVASNPFELSAPSAVATRNLRKLGATLGTSNAITRLSVGWEKAVPSGECFLRFFADFGKFSSKFCVVATLYSCGGGNFR